MISNYSVGTGIIELTDPANGLQMQGFADDRQKTGGVESPLFSRAFIIEKQQTGNRIMIVSADIWTATAVVKEEVIKRLTTQFGMLYTDSNVLISGTHTHSAPGGYAGYILYDLTGEGFAPNTFECIVSGIITSIQKAHHNLGPGKIYVSKGEMEDCGRNRSLGAYLNNPQSERDRYHAATDQEMLLLKFTKVDSRGNEYPVGLLNWFAIHPTDRGQSNRLVCGDSKGSASALFEARMKMDPFAPETFIAAFANSNAGDVSGNVEFGQIPDGIHDSEHMQKHAKLQYLCAKQLFDAASEELSGSVDYRHTRVDMSSVVIEGGQGASTWPAALGLSFAAGSTEDSVPNPPSLLKEGITVANIQPTESAMLAMIAALGETKGIPMAEAFRQAVEAGHSPKPIVLAVGATEGLVPKILPLQLLKIGQLVLTGVPAELTTMAGRRLRDTVLTELDSMGVRHVVLAGYANDYAQYVTTKEEYDMQHYEGASTLFGPYTLQAYQQEFRKLAIALKTGSAVDADFPPPKNFSSPARCWTFRNLSASNLELKFFNTNDSAKVVTLPNGAKTILAHQEVAYPEREFTGWGPGFPTVEVATVIFNGAQEKTVASGTLVTITEAGGIEITAYKPPTRTKPQASFVSMNAQAVPAAKGDPAIVQIAAGFLHLVYRDANDQIADIFWNGLGWGYANLSQLATGATAAKGNPAIVQFAAGFLHVVYRDANDQIADIFWNGSG